MTTGDFSLFSISQDEGMQKLDSTKRCLFPEDKSFEGYLGNGPYKVDGIGQNITGKNDLAEENVTSPTSVCVSVWSIGQPNLNCNLEEKIGDFISSRYTEISSLDRMSCLGDTGGVEEQTVIEVQYVEPTNRDRDSDVTELTHSPRRKNSNQEVLHERKNSNQEVLHDLTNSSTNFRDVRARPLLDIEKTPLRSPQKNNKKGAPTSFKTCSDWQAWSSFGFGRPGTGSCDRSVEQTPSKEKIRSILRRRTSYSLRARKSNVKELKLNLAPFGHSPARSPARALFRNRSFSVSDHHSAIVRVSKDRKPSKKSFTDVLKLCTMFEDTVLDSPDFVKKSSSNCFTDDDLSYDSDPEDFARRRPKLGAESFIADDSSILDESYNYRHFPTCSPSPSRAFLNVHNDEIFNQTTTFVLHPQMKSSYGGGGTVLQASARRPVAVDAWLERGQHLAYNLIQPKWIWKAKSRLDPGLSSVRQETCLQGIELLDITRILKFEDTEGYHNQSFAKPSHCLFIKSIHDEEFCFEAKSMRERDRLVSSLKLLIARFGAMVLTGDPQVYYEFFWMNEAAPGMAPEFNQVFAGESDS
eukprot:CAMPEP_0170877358 /NCGR_PEP_ID=MMETSP0734-20130129/30286_1 /TAXON_ID=186038 /ORGANISM="Fragilariopsis kerguelensis, Strain L26-C5" /LENGTH=581 /DNA_ID=CAMNT_0011259663 /DNA_START=99 /DNA_END=1845 /DNA_ORIENTATION=+